MSEYSFNLFSNNTNNNNENIQLIWMDNSPCPINIKSKLSELNSIMQFYTDINQCISLIKLIQNEQIILIVSMALAETILDKIHSYPLLISIFIFSSTNAGHEKMELMNKYKKIVEINSDFELLIKLIKQSIIILEQQIISFNLFNQKWDYTNDLSKDSASFLWYQLLIDILKQTPDNEQINKYILESYNQLNKNEINQFKKDFTKDKSIQLFNEKYFINKILKKSLRIKDIKFIYLFRYFMINLYEQIQLSKKRSQYRQTIKLFYGQKMSKTQLDKFKKHIGYVISPNGFFSASFNRDSSIALAKTEVLPKEYESVLFKIEITPTSQHITFVEINDKQEILFNINTIFRIKSIEFDSSLQLWEVNLNNDDIYRYKIEKYLRSVRTFTDEYSYLIFFGHLFTELDQLKQSEIYFHILINSLPSDHKDMASIYNQIGNFFADNGQLKLALDNYQHAYQIRQKKLANNHPHISVSLNNIGLIYKDQGDLDKALEYCEKALSIDEINYPDDHLFKAMAIDNIAGIYKEKHLFLLSQTYFLRALNMYKCVLPSNHHFFTDIYNNLGKVYCDQGYFDRSLQCYQKAYSICEINYINDHLQKAQTIENIGLLYKTNGMLEEALKELLKSLEMYKRIYSKDHPDIARCLGHIGLVYEANNDLNVALDYFNKQLNMDEKCLSNDHTNIQIDIQWIVDIYKKKGEFKKALEFSLKKFQEKKTLLGNNHSMVLAILMIIIDLTDDPIVKINYYKQAVSICENLIPSDHCANIRCLDAIIKFYFKNNSIQEALNYQIKMINLERQILPDDHIDLALALQRLGQMYEILSKPDEAKKCYTESEIIFKKHANNSSFNSSQNKHESHVNKSAVCILQ